MLQDLAPKHVKGRVHQPLLVAEYAGVGLDLSGPFGMNPKKFLAGYQGHQPCVRSAAEAAERIANLTNEIYKRPASFAGFCLTQLYDVEHEKNGLLLYDRRPKLNRKILRKTFNGSKQLGRWKRPASELKEPKTKKLKRKKGKRKKLGTLGPTSKKKKRCPYTCRLRLSNSCS